MEFEKRHSYLIQWLIGIGDLVVLNIMFIVVYMLLGSFYTKAIAYNIREVLLVLNVWYFLSLDCIPIQVHYACVLRG